MKFLKIPIPPFLRANSMHIIIKLNHYNFLLSEDSRKTFWLNFEPIFRSPSVFFLFYDFVLLVELTGVFLPKPLNNGLWKFGISFPLTLCFYGLDVFLTFSERICLLKILFFDGFCFTKFFKNIFFSLMSDSLVFCYFLSFLLWIFFKKWRLSDSSIVLNIGF